MSTKKTRLLIGATLLQQLARAAAPAKEIKFYDTRLTGFHIRHLPSGRAVFAMVLARGKAVTLGAVASWKDADAARDAAIELLRQFRATGTVPTVGRPDAAPKSAGLSVVEVFGLRVNASAANGDRPAPHADDARGLFRDAPNRPKSSKSDGMLDAFVRFVKPTTPLADVTPAQISDFVRQLTKRRHPRTGEPVKRTSVHRYLMDLRGALRWAVQQKHVAVNVAQSVALADIMPANREDRTKVTRWLQPDEEVRLRQAMRDRDAAMRAQPVQLYRIRKGATFTRKRTDGGRFIDHVEPIVLMALNTGGRKGGIFSLRWRHIVEVPFPAVCFEGKYQKAGQTYYVALNGEAWRMLQDWKPADAKPNDLIFESPTGQRLRNIDQAWYGLLRAAKISGFRFHDLRHTFASKLAQRPEVGMPHLQKLMGHADLRMTARYSHLADQHVRGLVELLNRPDASNAAQANSAPPAA